MEERRILESWKEIADYLKRSVRTCKRWEPKLGLPIHRLDGTPSARVFAYADELDRWLTEKLNHIKAEAKTPAVPRILKKKWPLFAAAAVVVIAVLGAFVRPLLFLGSSPIPSNNPILAILPFENVAGDEILESWRTAFPDLLITDLRQSRYVNVIPSRDMFLRLKELKLENGKKFSGEDLGRIAGRVEADFTATGSLIKSGEDFVINIFIQGSKSGQAGKTLRASVRGEQALLNKADDFSKEIKSALNLTRRHIAADIDERVQKIATSSPRAVKLYSLAVRPRGREALPNRILTLQKAIELDSEFGLAYALLFYIYDTEKNIEDKVRCYQKALALPGRLSERERLLLQEEFYDSYLNWSTFARLAEASLPASVLKGLRPKGTGEQLDVLEKLASLYPDFSGAIPDNDYLGLLALSSIYMSIEEWDKAIAVLEKSMTKAQRIRDLAPRLIECYRAKGLIDKAEQILNDLTRDNPGPNFDGIRRGLALDRRKFEDAQKSLNKQYAGPLKQKKLPYIYFSQVGYVHWLKDDLEDAEQAYRTIVDPDNLEEDWQRTIDLAALCASQGKVSQALEHAHRLLQLADKIKGLPYRMKVRELQARCTLAYFYRLAGRMPEALKEAEEACRDYKNPGIPANLAMQLLHARALATLEMNRWEEFEKQTEEIKEFTERERYPKLKRVYYHLLGLRELRQNSGYRAIVYFNKALDLSTPITRNNDPSLCLYSLAEAYESTLNLFAAIRRYEEISHLAKRGSAYGDIYARSFYRAAKAHDDNWSQSRYRREDFKLKAIENYRKFLSLWGNADPIFSEVGDARSRLAILESK
jgi:tetratricopeptide (TPR) repeat protein